MGKLDLSQIASKLESLEESIIFRFIDRVQFAKNSAVYEEGRFPFSSDKPISLLDHKLLFAEKTDAVLGRYTIAEERPFFTDLPLPPREMENEKEEHLFVRPLQRINLTDKIKSAYLSLLDKITTEDEDRDFGTTAELDIALLQAISRRVHYGSFYVAEAKYLQHPDQFQALINQKNLNGLMDLLTRQEVEDKIIERIKLKCEHIQSISNPSIRKQIDGEAIAKFYFDTIIPLTKEGEILYLINRKTDNIITKERISTLKTALDSLEIALKSGDKEKATELLNNELKDVPLAQELKTSLL